MFTRFPMFSKPSMRRKFSESMEYLGVLLALIVVLAAPTAQAQAITWNGNINGNWDIGITTNWLDASSAPVSYQDGDDVTFDDTATGTTTVTLTNATLAPSSITINSSNAYTFTGSGGLGGGVLSKSGDGTLTIGNTGANTFGAPVFISGGTIRLSGSADRLPHGTSVTLADAPGAALDLNNQNQTIFTLNGGGSTGGNISLGSGTLTLTGGGAYAGQISGSGKVAIYGASWAILSGSNTYSGGTYFAPGSLEQIQNTDGSGTGTGNVTLDDSAEICFGNVFRTTTTPSLGIVGAPAVTNGFTLNKAILLLSRNDDFVFDPVLYGGGYIYFTFGYGRTILNHANFNFGTGLASYGPVRINDSAALGTGEFWSGGVAAAGLELGNNITVANLIQLNGKAANLRTNVPVAANIINVTGTNTLTGPFRFNSEGNDWVFRSDAGKLVLANSSMDTAGGTHNFWLRGVADGEVVNGFTQSSAVGAVRNLFKDDGGTWILDGASTYAGFTAISNGTLVVNGSINPAAAAPDTRVLVTGTGTLGGTGTIGSEVVVFDGGTLAPGASIGTLTINSNLTLTNCTCVFELAASGGVVSCDQVSGIVNLTNGGAVTLQATLTGSVIGGEVFHLFNAAAYYGTFSSFNLPALTGGFSWDTTKLSVDGTLRVASPQIKATQLSYVHGGHFQMSGTSSATNATYRIQATTNLVNPLSWVQVGTGSFANGVFSFTDTNSANFRIRFYRVVTP